MDKKPIVLFVGDYYCGGNPALGLSEWEGNIWASLEATGLVTVKRFHPDKYVLNLQKRSDETLLKSIKEIKPDFIVMIVYKWLGYDGADPVDPTHITLTTIMKIKVPIITIFGDLEDDKQQLISQLVSPLCWKVIGTANKEVVERMGYQYMHVPKDPKIFNNPNKTRDIDVVFSGSYGYGREERTVVLQYLKDKGINLLLGGSEGGDHFTTQEYADRYKRSKIALSFSRARGMNVVNARPFEAMLCGAMLMEQDSPELAKLYTPNVDYVEWTDEIDLLKKVRYYLEHNDERTLIASNGQRKTEELYSAKTFWTKVLER